MLSYKCKNMTNLNDFFLLVLVIVCDIIMVKWSNGQTFFLDTPSIN